MTIARPMAPPKVRNCSTAEFAIACGLLGCETAKQAQHYLLFSLASTTNADIKVKQAKLIPTPSPAIP